MWKLASFLVSWLALTAGLWSVDQIPSPLEDPIACGRSSESFICIPDGYIGQATADWFDQRVLNFSKASSISCGSYHRLLSAWIDQMKIEDDETVEMAAQRFSEILRLQWAKINSGCDGSVFLFSSVKDQVIAITYGPEANQLSNHLDEIITAMSIPNYNQSLIVGTQKILASLETIEIQWYWVSIGGSIFLILLILFICLLRFRRRQPPVEVDECPICFELLKDLPVVILSCGHQYCSTCIYTWFHGKLERVCPICQKVISSTELDV